VLSNRRKLIESEVSEAKLPTGGALPVTLSVDPNEKIFLLMEKNSTTKDATTSRRFQVMYVRRSGELTAFVRDLGEVSEDVGEFVFPCMWEYSVAEAADVANMWREEQDLKEKLDERAEKSTLVDDFWTLQEVKQAVRKNQTVFGYGSTAPTSQRNYRIGK